MCFCTVIVLITSPGWVAEPGSLREKVGIDIEKEVHGDDIQTELKAQQLLADT